MPTVDNGREKIKQFMKEKGISVRDLAAVYGMQHTDLHKYLEGELKTKRSNEIILQIISDYKIR